MVKPVTVYAYQTSFTILRGVVATASAAVALQTAKVVQGLYDERIDAAVSGGRVSSPQTALADTTYGLAYLSGRGCQLWCAGSIVEQGLAFAQLTGNLFGMRHEKVKFLSNAMNWIMPKNDYLYMGVLGGSALTVFTGAVTALTNCASANRRHAD